jgi:hypothetical protein
VIASSGRADKVRSPAQRSSKEGLGLTFLLRASHIARSGWGDRLGHTLQLALWSLISRASHGKSRPRLTSLSLSRSHRPPPLLLIPRAMPPSDPTGRYKGKKYDPNFVHPNEALKQGRNGPGHNGAGGGRSSLGGSQGGYSGTQGNRAPAHQQPKNGSFGNGYTTTAQGGGRDDGHATRAGTTMNTPSRNANGNGPYSQPGASPYNREQASSGQRGPGGQGYNYSTSPAPTTSAASGRGTPSTTPAQRPNKGPPARVEVPADRPPPPVNFVTGRNKGKGNPNSVNWGGGPSTGGQQDAARGYAGQAGDVRNGTDRGVEGRGRNTSNGYAPNSGGRTDGAHQQAHQDRRFSTGPDQAQHGEHRPNARYDPPSNRQPPTTPGNAGSTPSTRSSAVHPSRLAQVPHAEVPRQTPSRSEQYDHHSPLVSHPGASSDSGRRSDRPAPLDLRQHANPVTTPSSFRTDDTSGGGLTAMAH